MLVKPDFVVQRKTRFGSREMSVYEMPHHRDARINFGGTDYLFVGTGCIGASEWLLESARAEARYLVRKGMFREMKYIGQDVYVPDWEKKLRPSGRAIIDWVRAGNDPAQISTKFPRAEVRAF